MSSISFESTYHTATRMPVWVLPALGTMLLLVLIGDGASRGRRAEAAPPGRLAARARR
jgi:hypothetical protein